MYAHDDNGVLKNPLSISRRRWRRKKREKTAADGVSSPPYGGDKT